VGGEENDVAARRDFFEKHRGVETIGFFFEAEASFSIAVRT
jgi:hypothetical protein